MELFDLLLLFILGVFAIAGLIFGFLHTLGSLIGTVLGVYLASRYYEPVADFLIGATGWAGNWPRVVVFALAFVIINRLVGLAFFFVDKFFKVVTSLPVIRGLNKTLGFAFGLFEGLVTIGVIIYFIERFPVSERISTAIASSIIAPFAEEFTKTLWPLLPDALTLIQSSVNYAESMIH
ncbi:CvpA family protein [Candidatus Nomurabacteria bacterium]|nr:CvpA family protein [Candidatus Nomurabacteria bacterium]